jgi:hypothetical protein
MEKKQQNLVKRTNSLLPPKITEAKHIIATVKIRRLVRVAIFLLG